MLVPDIQKIADGDCLPAGARHGGSHGHVRMRREIIPQEVSALAHIEVLSTDYPVSHFLIRDKFIGVRDIVPEVGKHRHDIVKG